MEMYYVTKGINNYIQVNGGQNIIQKNSPQAYRLKMLENNHIEGLIQPIAMEMDGCLTLKYNTGSSYVLDRLFLKLKPDGGFLRIIMEQIEKLLIRLKEYLLEPDDLVIRPEYMFYDWGGKILKLIYVPGYGRSLRAQLKEFLEYIMKIFDHRDDAGVRYMYGMYDLVSEDTFSLDDFAYKLESSNVSGEVLRGEEELSLTYENQSTIGNIVPKEKHITKLVPLTSGALKEMILSKYDEMILVGRGKKETDYRIQTTQISRVHACIYLRSNGVYIEDRESTNGTFINSVRLEPLKQQLIQVGDLVNFANEEFFAV
ncbi:MAG: FHA domain-containing protein [Lachnospiraceae bacterium]|nr:FHA domain-containing protein [Lachnospiraceae bacterium]